MFRNDVNSGLAESVIESYLGQLVLDGKPMLSHDCGEPGGQICPMGEDTSKSAFVAAFTARTKAARKARGPKMTQQAMADLLGIRQDKYKQYEGRSMLPHDLIPTFLIVTGVEWDWLFQGKGEGPAWELPVPKVKGSRTHKKGRKAA